MDRILSFVLGNMNVWTPIAAFIIAFFSAYRGDRPGFSKYRFLHRFLAWSMLLVVGLMGISGFIYHVFLGETTAKMIGWAQSPFQYEVGIANLSYGILGVIAFFASFPFQLATGIGFAIWFFGDAIGHIYQLFTLHDIAPYNAGSTLYTDILLPIIILFLLWLVHRHRSESL